MKDTSRANVHAAYVGESKAVFRLRVFAKKADEEGY
jgi:rubrerythrin